MKKIVTGLSFLLLASCAGKSNSTINPYLVNAENYNKPTATVISDIANKKVSTASLTAKEAPKVQINLKDYKQISSEDFIKTLKEQLAYLDPRQNEGSKYTEIQINSLYEGEEMDKLICSAKVKNELQVLVSSSDENRVETVQKTVDVEILENNVTEQDCLQIHGLNQKVLNLMSYTDLMKEVEPRFNVKGDVFKITENTYGVVVTDEGMALQMIISLKDGVLDINDSIIMMLKDGKVTQGVGRFTGYESEGNLVDEGEVIPAMQQTIDEDNFTVSVMAGDITITSKEYPVLDAEAKEDIKTDDKE